MIFRQVRVGRDGEVFTVYKFRTMVVDAETHLEALRERSEGNGVLFKLKDDPRVTRVGRFLRRFSLDELPQLWNVLVGSMSLVGPAPGAAQRGRALRPVHRAPPARQAGHHRSLAGQRPVRPLLGGQRPAGPLLRGELVVRRRHPDPLEDAVGRGARPGRLLTGRGAPPPSAILHG